ncbi:MAG: stalk domain-containing protein [Defluviitaleaceae bacterium]|nr:stalk domain-containing protein [Defluviitaleaceae bacterium]
MNTIFKRSIATILAIVMVFTSSGVVAYANEEILIQPESFDVRVEVVGAPLQADTWFETAWAIWESLETGYTIQVRLTPGENAYYWRTDDPIDDPDWDMYLGWVEVDSELIRLIDPDRNIWRVDIPGLPRGTYDVRALAADGETQVWKALSLETTSFPRYGAAFIPSDELVGTNAVGVDVGPTTNWAPYGATGGYLSDGRIDPDAAIMYVSHNNWADFTVANLTRGSGLRGDSPMVVRFLGTVGNFEWEVGASEIPPGVVDGIGDNDRMMNMGNNAHQITLEGIGPGSGIHGWGIFTGGSVNVVIRNLHVSGYLSFGLRASSTTTNYWAHHNTLHYGQNWFFNIDAETDRTMGRGSMDIEQWVRGYTLAYNHFNGGRGTNLIVGGVQNAPLTNSVNRHYGTIHHNIYDNAQERNPRTRHHNLHMFNNLFREVIGHPLHYRLADRYTGYGIGSAHNATIWAEGNIFDDVGFPFLRSRHGHARGYYPHTGHNHFFGDAPGFIVTGDNRQLGSGAQLGGTVIPAFGDWGYNNTVRGLGSAADLADLVSTINTLQPNWMCANTASTFDNTLDLGITVNQVATMMVPPSTDILYPAAGFPAMAATTLANGWGFEGDFRPSALDNVWPTGSMADVTELRTHIETYAGAMPNYVPTAPTVAPSNVTVSLNDLDFFMHRQPSPTPSLRTITYSGTFTINWNSTDAFAEYYEIQYQDGGAWRTLGTVPAGDRRDAFTTQDMNDFGYLVMSSPNHDWVAVHLGGDGYVVMYPHENFGHPDHLHYTAGDIPAISSLNYTAPWVIANMASGGTYDFRVRAVNSLGAGPWATQNLNVAANQPRIETVSQSFGVLPNMAVAMLPFDVETLGIADGTYDITLSVPRTLARNVIPWPANQNFSRSIFLTGNNPLDLPEPTLFGGGAARRPYAMRGNGGVGTIDIVNGTGSIGVALDATIPEGIYDLVLTIEVGNRNISMPFSLNVGPNFFSLAIALEFEALAAPTNLNIFDSILYWNPVEYATDYRVYVNGVDASLFATDVDANVEPYDENDAEENEKEVEAYQILSFDLSTLQLDDGEYTIQVRALGDGLIFWDSELSDYVRFVVGELSDEDYDYSEYPYYEYPEYPENEYPENEYPENDYSENEYPENDYSVNEYPENDYSVNEYPENDYSVNEYPENDYSVNEYPENDYSENEYPEYGESENEEPDYEGSGYTDNDNDNEEFVDTDTTPDSEPDYEASTNEPEYTQVEEPDNDSSVNEDNTIAFTGIRMISNSSDFSSLRTLAYFLPANETIGIELDPYEDYDFGIVSTLELDEVEHTVAISSLLEENISLTVTVTGEDYEAFEAALSQAILTPNGEVILTVTLAEDLAPGVYYATITVYGEVTDEEVTCDCEEGDYCDPDNGCGAEDCECPEPTIPETCECEEGNYCDPDNGCGAEDCECPEPTIPETCDCEEGDYCDPDNGCGAEDCECPEPTIPETCDCEEGDYCDPDNGCGAEDCECPEPTPQPTPTPAPTPPPSNLPPQLHPAPGPSVVGTPSFNNRTARTARTPRARPGAVATTQPQAPTQPPAQEHRIHAVAEVLDAEAAYFINMPELLLVMEVDIFVNDSFVYFIDTSTLVSIDISHLTLEDLTRLVAVLFYLEDENDPTSISFMTIQGFIDGNYFMFTVSESGLYGLKLGVDQVVIPTTPPINLPTVPGTGTQIELRMQIGSTLYHLNGVAANSEVVPFIDPVYERTMVPLALVAETLGADVSWIPETRTVVITRDGITITMQADTPLPNNMGMPAIVNGRTFVPIAYVAQVFGANVQWDGANRVVYIQG